MSENTEYIITDKNFAAASLLIVGLLIGVIFVLVML